MTTALVIHGHFYQPPRENPWSGAIERERSAHPYHDWNERILAECYRANAFARIVEPDGRVSSIVNNYARISFNFGPTLLSWIEENHPDVYARILEADRISYEANGGHGNAIAQAYNHTILPLSNERDRWTQIIWGISDFQHRFRRAPEAMWLPETACNEATLDALIDAGMRYVILSPYQAEAVRARGGDWKDVSDGSIDPGVAYRYRHGDGSDREIAIFFYDAPIARSMAFEGGLSSSQVLVDRLSQAHGGDGRLVQFATDGESYGHHAKFGDRSLAYAVMHEAESRGFEITNYAAYLEKHPAELDVRLKPGPGGEGTAWSCAHGLGRWRRDCGCHTGGQHGWNQAWRRPLREALDYLRDIASDVFENEAGEFLEDPWKTRNDYVKLFLDSSLHPEDFLRSHTDRRLRGAEQVRALSLLEMQRDSLLMYTSCGWFFNDISGIETLQVLKYAGRVLSQLEEYGSSSPAEGFLDILSAARSNIPDHGNGADVYRKFVEPSRLTRRGIAAHLAFTCLVNVSPERGKACEYTYQIADLRKEQLGRISLATGRVFLESIRTLKQLDAVFAAIHFGGVDFYCLVKPFPGSDRLRGALEQLWRSFRGDSLPRILRVAQEEFGPDEFGLDHVLPGSRERISEIVYGNLLRHFSEQYALLYQDHHRTLEMLQSAGFELPAELRVAAEFTLGKRFEEEIRRQNGSSDAADYAVALRIAREVELRGYQIDRSAASERFSEMLASLAEDLVGDPRRERVVALLEQIDLSTKLCGTPPVERAQEIVFSAVDSIPTGEERERLLDVLWLAPTAEGPAGREDGERDSTQQVPAS